MSDSKLSKSFVVSTIGGLTLLALAVAVFSVAVKARSVSGGAERTVELVESLRVVSLSRSELSTAARLDSLAPDDTQAIEAALANSADAIAAARTALEDSASAELLDAFAAYERAARAQSDQLLDPGHSENAAIIAEASTGTAFDALATTLRAEQEDTLRTLGADNEFMNTIGTVATFIVAFVVPSAALYIFESLRRAPRRTRELDLHASRLESRSVAAAMALQQEVAALRLHLFGAADTTDEQRKQNVKRALLRLDNLALVNGAMHHWQTQEVDLLAVVAEISGALPEGEELTISTGPIIRPAKGDPLQVALIVHELVRNAFNHGSRPVSVEIRDSDRLTLSVVDHGPGLTPVVESAVLLERDYALRGNLANGRFGYGLLAARMAAQSMGGSLSYQRVDDRTVMIVELPAGEAIETLTAPPDELPAAA